MGPGPDLGTTALAFEARGQTQFLPAPRTVSPWVSQTPWLEGAPGRADALHAEARPGCPNRWVVLRKANLSSPPSSRPAGVRGHQALCTALWGPGLLETGHFPLPRALAPLKGGKGLSTKSQMVTPSSQTDSHGPFRVLDCQRYCSGLCSHRWGAVNWGGGYHILSVPTQFTGEKWILETWPLRVLLASEICSSQHSILHNGPGRAEMLSPDPTWGENSLILQSSKCNWALDMQMLYVMVIWRKTGFRNVGVIYRLCKLVILGAVKQSCEEIGGFERKCGVKKKKE